MRSKPPRAAQWLLRAFLNDAAFESVAGDLDEEFARGRTTAWYWRQTIKSVAAHGVGTFAAGAAAFATDLRLAARTLARQRRLVAVATLTLGFGVAICAMVLAAVNAYLVRGLPYPEARRLHNVGLFVPGIDLPPKLETLDWASLDDLVDVRITWDLDLFNLRGAPYAESVQSTWVTAGYMQGFGVRTAMGRTFGTQDYAADAPPVAIISHRLWQSRFNGDPAIVGKHFESFAIDRPEEIGVFTIVGVLPERHWHTQAFTDILAPLKIPNVPYVVRIREGVPAEAVADRINTLVRSRHEMPANWRATVTSQHDAYVLTVRPLLLTLSAAAVLVLLIASANVAVLLLIRASGRTAELAMRRALGAGSGRIARMLIAEAVVLGAAASAAGLLLARVFLSAMAPLAARQLGRPVPGGPDALQLDGLVIAGVAGAGLLIVLVCSIVPIWASLRSAATSPASGQKAATSSPAQHRARMGLVAVEIAACLALLVSAVAMVQSGLRILNVDIGLRTDGVHVTRISLRQASYPDPASRVRLFDRLTTDAAGVTEGLAFGTSWPLQAPGQRDVRGNTQSPPSRAGVITVSANYFRVLDIPITEGRAFGAGDVIGAPRVAIISATLAARAWPGERAVGQRLRLLPPANAPNAPQTEYEVVGVVADTRHSHTDTDTADVFVPLSQFGALASFVYLRSSGDPSAVFTNLRAKLAQIDDGVVTGSLRELADILDQERAGPRFLAQLLVVFSGLATLLALVGLHSVIAYAAGQRRREIAIRIAVGASRGSVAGLFLRQGAVMVALGLAAGIGGAIALGRLLQAQLFGVQANNPVVIAATAAAFGICALAAALAPARRASRVDPVEALKGS